MKKIIATLLLFVALPLCAQDCAKSADACSAPKKALSPFLAAAAEPAAVKQVPASPSAAAKPGPAKKTQAAEVSTAPAAVPVQPQKDGPAASSPVWLLFVGGLLAGLYFYLGAGRGKGKK